VKAVRARQRRSFARALESGAVYDDKPSDLRDARLQRARALLASQNGDNPVLAKAVELMTKQQQQQQQSSSSSSSATTKTKQQREDRKDVIQALVFVLALTAALLYVFVE